MKKKRQTMQGSLIRYPWDEWILGRKKEYTLEQGIDFECRGYCLVNQLRAAAKTRGRKVKVMLSRNARGRDVIWFRVSDRIT